MAFREPEQEGLLFITFSHKLQELEDALNRMCELRVDAFEFNLILIGAPNAMMHHGDGACLGDAAGVAMTRGRTALVGSGFALSTTSSSSRSRSAPIISGRPPPPPWPRWRLGWRCPRQKIRKGLGCGTTDNGAATLGCARTAARRRRTRRRRGRRWACACSATRCGRGTRAGRAQPPPQCENVSRATYLCV